MCREGRLYDVDRWIGEGKPLQLAPEAILKGTRPKTALQIALEAGQHSLAFAGRRQLLFATSSQPTRFPEWVMMKKLSRHRALLSVVSTDTPVSHLAMRLPTTSTA
jgi:hypothetical protein